MSATDPPQPEKPRSVFLSDGSAARLAEILGCGAKRAEIRLRRAWKGATYDAIQGWWRVPDLSVEIALNNRRVTGVRRFKARL